ncbi:carbohydrate-binding protein [Pedosphaera parvula]|uniref:carbohydrate-binding protein n=1 Tax=Pedosphaera parvula TaxID=1032527 RepID=UPI0002FFE549|nr:carbohydrate-binding protein [Pedosphaera parvula]
MIYVFHPMQSLRAWREAVREMKNYLGYFCLLSIALSLMGLGNKVYAIVGATTPFISFEAEAGTFGGGAAIVSLVSPPTTPYSSPQLEASGHAYVQLTATGQYVEWVNNTGQSITAINVRESIPDAPNGGGITATLNLYVNGVFRQSLNLNSMQTWLYENSTNYNGNDQNPADGSPRVFFDDVHTFIAGGAVTPGSTIRLQKDSTNSAAFYYIDVVDLETPPAALTQPANSLSISAYNAIANNSSVDNSAAIQNCINDAQTQGKSVWIPAGTYYVRTMGGLTATGITIQGAGIWYSTIYRNMPLPNPSPLGAIFNLTSCTVRNFSLDANATSRAVVDGCGGAMDTSGNNWLADGIWTQHTMSGFWASGTGGTVQNCRLTSIWADGINLNNVSLNGTVGNNLTNRNNFVRGTGDDANAINSVNYNGNQYYAPMNGVVIMNTTAIAPWGGKGVAIYGGTGHLVENNFMSDTARYVGLGVMKFGVNGSDLLSATVTGNTVLRCGGNGYSQQQQAMMIGNGGDGQSVGTVANAYVASNNIIDSLYSAVGFSTGTNTVFQYNTIIAPGLDGIAIGPPSLGAGVLGTAIIKSNIVTGLNPGRLALTNSSIDYEVITPIPAANYNGTLGVAIETCDEGGQNIGNISSGDWTAYNNIDLSGLNTFVARVASAGSGGNIEIHLDSPGGTMIGTCAVVGTGGSQTYLNMYCGITNTSESHNIYLVYSGGSGILFNLQFLGFYSAPSMLSHQLVVGNTYSLKALANGKFVSAPNGGTNALIAGSASVGVTEQFQVVDAGGGNIALLAMANNQYVCADNNGASPLIANRTSFGSWETFTEFDAGGGNIGLRAMNNGRYVTTGNGGTNALIAQSTTIGTSESFTVGFVSGVPPGAPLGLMATAGNFQVALSWAASVGATIYNIKRSLTSGGPYTIVATNVTDLAYTNTSLANGTTYFFVVSSQNSAGESANSSPIIATPGTLDRTGWVVASNTSGSDAPANAIDLDLNTRWSTGASQTAGQWFQVDMGSARTFYKIVLNTVNSSGDYPRGYQVNVSNDGLAWGSPVATGTGASAITTITFATQAARYIRITQTGSAQGSYWSIHDFNVYGTPPLAPLGITVTNATSNQIGLSWTASVSATSYNVKRAATSGGPYINVATNLIGFTYTDTGLTNGTIYYYVVSAVNLFGESANSVQASARPVAITVPQLHFGMSSSLMQLNWPQDHTGWRLESQTNSIGAGLSTNWFTVSSSGATNQIFVPVSTTNGSLFFRLVYP